jgi:hypothetical protein
MATLSANTNATQAIPLPSSSSSLSPQFMQWCQNFMATKNRSGAQCKLACETKNPGAQVIGTISKQFGGTEKHSNNNTAIFPSVVHGIAAHVALIRDMCTRGRRDGCSGGASKPRCTLVELKQIWAPVCHNNASAPGFQNNPSSYANTVANWVGMQSNQVFNPSDMDQMAKIALASARVEVGFINYTCEQLAQGVSMAYGKIPPGAEPADVGALKSLTASIEGKQSPLTAFMQGYTGQNEQQNGQNQFAAPGEWGQQSPQAGSGASQSSGSEGSGMPQNLFEQLTQRKLQEQQWQNQAFTPTTTGSSDSSDDTTEDGELTCEDSTVSWSCDSTATMSRALSKPTDHQFKTRGALIGSLVVSPTKKTTYTVQCLKKQSIISEHSCVMSPRKKTETQQPSGQPVLSITTDTTEVVRGKSVLISWAAVKVDACTVYGEGFSEEGVEGSATTDALFTRGTATYTLECRTADGDAISKSVDVRVK